jgi:hypothetical protein
MSLFLATLIPGLILVGLGAALLGGASAAFQAFPRSQKASMVVFGAGTLWFLWIVWHLSPVDFGDYKVPLFIGFAAIGALAFKCVPDFLAVRGLSIIVLLGAAPMLEAAYMHYELPRRLWMVSAVYVAIALALVLGAQPYRLRDFFEWLFARSNRARGLGGALAAYGLLLCAVAFTY